MLHKSFVVFVLVVSLAFATPALAAPSFEVSWWSPVVDWWVGWVEWMGLGPEDAVNVGTYQPELRTIYGEGSPRIDPIGHVEEGASQDLVLGETEEMVSTESTQDSPTP